VGICLPQSAVPIAKRRRGPCTMRTESQPSTWMNLKQSYMEIG